MQQCFLRAYAFFLYLLCRCAHSVPDMASKKKPLNLFLPGPLIAATKDYCERSNRDVSELIGYLLRNYLEARGFNCDDSGHKETQNTERNIARKLNETTHPSEITEEKLEAWIATPKGREFLEKLRIELEETPSKRAIA